MTQPQQPPAKPQEQQRAQARPIAAAGGKVVVACKTPAGIVIRPFRWSHESELVMGGGSREIRVARPTGRPVVINGNARRIGADLRCRIVAGYALTEGIDAEIWQQWRETHEESDLVRNDLVFAHESLDHVVAWAKEHGATRSGLEPLEKNQDARTPRPKPGNRNVAAIEQDEEAPAAAPT